ncbi:unnamed protein product, partial [Nesidiocoris tenuis]
FYFDPRWFFGKKKFEIYLALSTPGQALGASGSSLSPDTGPLGWWCNVSCKNIRPLGYNFLPHASKSAAPQSPAAHGEAEPYPPHSTAVIAIWSRYGHGTRSTDGHRAIRNWAADVKK